MNVSAAIARVPVKLRVTLAPEVMSREPVPRAAAFEQVSVPVVILLAPVKLLVPERVRARPPDKMKPPAPLMLPLHARGQATLMVAVAFRVIGPVHDAPQPLLL